MPVTPGIWTLEMRNDFYRIITTRVRHEVSLAGHGHGHGLGGARSKCHRSVQTGGGVGSGKTQTWWLTYHMHGCMIFPSIHLHACIHLPPTQQPPLFSLSSSLVSPIYSPTFPHFLSPTDTQYFRSKKERLRINGRGEWERDLSPSIFSLISPFQSPFRYFSQYS